MNDTTGICSIMEGTGAGLGVFIQYMGTALPVLLIILGVIGGIIAIIMAIASVIRGSVAKVHKA